MTYITTVEPNQAQGNLKGLYEAIQKNMGVVPSFLRVMGHRPDVLEVFMPLYQRLMKEEHKLSQVTKELVICYVSKINSCEY